MKELKCEELQRADRCIETLAGIPDAALPLVAELVAAAKKLEKVIDEYNHRNVTWVAVNDAKNSLCRVARALAQQAEGETK